MKHLSFPYSIPTSLGLELATSREDLEQAFRVLHDGYVGRGFDRARESGLRVTKYHALPTTAVLVARWEGRVVGTISVVQDSRFGLPIDGAFAIGAFRGRGRRVVEFSALAVAAAYRERQPNLFLLLSKVALQYAAKELRADYAVICVNPRDTDYYERVLRFRRLAQTDVAHYDFANGNPAVGFFLPLRWAEGIWRRASRGVEKARNVYDFYIGFRPAAVRLPPRTHFRTSDLTMTPETLGYFFREKSDVLTSLSPGELAYLGSFYSAEAYRALLPKSGTQSEPRFATNLFARGVSARSPVPAIRVLNASQSGLGLAARPRSLSPELSLWVEIAPTQSVRLRGKIVWEDARGNYGARLEDVPEEWLAYVDNHAGAARAL